MGGRLRRSRDEALARRAVRRRREAVPAALGAPRGAGRGAGYDPRHGGYSKLFAFLRSLQTAEERSSAGYVTGKALSMARLAALARFCDEKGDAETARLLGDGARRGRAALLRRGQADPVAVAATEESQARARRAAYRTLELAAEMVEPLQLRKILLKKRR